VWIELHPERLPRSAPPLQEALAMLLLAKISCPPAPRRSAPRPPAPAWMPRSTLDAEIDDVIAAILI